MARNTAGSTRSEKVAAMQKQAKAADRRRGLLIWGILALVLALVAGAIGFAVLNRPTLSEVQSYPDLTRNHVDGPVEYPTDPPAGGDHHLAWWDCGIYTEELPEHHAVHSLEHGAVWLTYQTDLPAAQIEELTRLADQPFMLLSPHSGQDSPVIATAWGKQLSVTSADDPRLPLFIREFRQGPQTPEPGAACTGGTTTDLLTGQ